MVAVDLGDGHGLELQHLVHVQPQAPQLPPNVLGFLHDVTSVQLERHVGLQCLANHLVQSVGAAALDGLSQGWLETEMFSYNRILV